MTYSIEVGRWTGIFSPVYYADVFIDGQDSTFYHTFNALTKRGAIKKARKYINRISHVSELKEIYSYDAITHTLSRIS